VLPSLLAFDPSSVGQPPFADLVEGVIPLESVFKFKGTVVPGFGRGSKVTQTICSWPMYLSGSSVVHRCIAVIVVVLSTMAMYHK